MYPPYDRMVEKAKGGQQWITAISTAKIPAVPRTSLLMNGMKLKKEPGHYQKMIGRTYFSLKAVASNASLAWQ